MSDGALVTLAIALVLVPGLVTTALGLLLLVPRIRSAAGPGLTEIGLRGLRRVPVVTYTTAFTDFRRGPSGDDRDYIDGEVIDVRDVDAPALPNENSRVVARDQGAAEEEGLTAATPGGAVASTRYRLCCRIRVIDPTTPCHEG